MAAQLALITSSPPSFDPTARERARDLAAVAPCRRLSGSRLRDRLP
jgi:hypothetical protein